MGNWRRNLKTWDAQHGNYNGFVFRLVPQDFLLVAGEWFDNRNDSEQAEEVVSGSRNTACQKGTDSFAFGSAV